MKRNPNILIIGGKNIGKTLLTFKNGLYYLDFYENQEDIVHLVEQYFLQQNT